MKNLATMDSLKCLRSSLSMRLMNDQTTYLGNQLESEFDISGYYSKRIMPLFFLTLLTMLLERLKMTVCHL